MLKKKKVYVKLKNVLHDNIIILTTWKTYPLLLDVNLYQYSDFYIPLISVEKSVHFLAGH